MKTSIGKIPSKSFSIIMGINKIAPAGGKFIFTLLKAMNNIIHAIIVQIESGMFMYTFKISLIKQPVSQDLIIL